MTTRPYAVNLLDPRAPSTEQWAALSDRERAKIVDQLPSEVPRRTAPEGDAHRDPKEKALDALREYYRRLGRNVYLSAELPVYYPEESLFAPDVIAVLDVDPHPRKRWVVSQEGRGIDFALEVTLEGDRKKDLQDNVERYARLGIPEYFVLDVKFKRILGYRLGRGGYEPIMPQGDRWSSRLLGLDLAFERERVRFFAGSAPLPQSEELITRLDSMISDLVQKEQELAHELEEAHSRAEQEKSRAEQEKSRADRLAQRLRELGIEPDEEPKTP